MGDPSLRSGLMLLVIIALLLFAKPLVKNEVLTIRDHSDYFQPLRYFTAQELRRGHLPLWNPYNASGEPWLANPQTGVFYPPSWMFVVLPFARAYVLFLALHVALLGCGALLLFRRLASPPAALLGALSLMLCGPSLSLLDVSNTLTTFAWIPLVLWSALAMAPAAVCAALIAMSFLAGEPFFAALAALLFVILRAGVGCHPERSEGPVWAGGAHIEPPDPHRSLATLGMTLRSMIDLLDIALTALAISAVQLFPFVASLIGSDRAGNVDAAEILRDSLPLRDWLHVFFGGASRQHFVPVVYVGIVASLLACVAIGSAWRLRAVQGAIALLVFAALIAAGSSLPFVGAILTRLPVTVLRYPARMLPIAALAITALAAIGWDSIRRFVSYRWLPFALAVLIVADLTPAIAPLMHSAPFDPHPTPYDGGVARDSKMMRFLRGREFDRLIWISGYLNLFDRRFDAWTAAPVVSQRYARQYAAALARPQVRNAMSIGYLLIEKPPRHVLVYRNRGALPLAFWSGDDGRIVVPSLLALTTTAAHITVDAPADGVVVLTQQNASGWSVTIDDIPARALSGEIFRAVHVMRGHHAIAWRYRPPSLVAGAIITAIGISRLFLLPIFVKRRTKKNFF